ncbi:hypothetical protein KDW54_17675 [Burkholderia ambifaria]|uniref:hypothetical protein n=1 Tax=Burkholderia ambifaria TaxID=152480 RepID=UPI001B9B71F7|nr:hypothetical protein [Burkholderia ambifaria]MBR8184231.1 hypothetical protein [Burkholderia ambifaria]
MKILELPLPFVTPRDVALPRRDEFGVPYGEDYLPILDGADNSRMATRASFAGVKFWRVHEALALNEKRALLAFGFNPYVISVRDQYPLYDQEAYNRARLRGTRMPFSDLSAVDIVLTIVSPDTPGLHQHVVSIKDAQAEFDHTIARQLERENSRCSRRQWTWEVLRGDQFGKRAWINNWLMRSWICGVDINRHYDEAQAFASRLLNCSRRGYLDQIMDRHARHLGIPSDRAYELFAIGTCFGFLYPDRNEELRVDKPLHLEFAP